MRKSFFYKPSNLNLRFAETPVDGEQGGGKPANSTDVKGSDDEQLGENGVKALNAEREARKAADQKVKDLEKQIADSKKSAETLAEEALETAKSDAAAANLRALRFEVAAESGLDLKLAARLAGSTREELLEDAKSLKELVGSKSAAPKPDPNQGGGSDAPAKGVSAGRELFAEQRSSKK